MPGRTPKPTTSPISARYSLGALTEASAAAGAHGDHRGIAQELDAVDWRGDLGLGRVDEPRILGAETQCHRPRARPWAGRRRARARRRRRRPRSSPSTRFMAGEPMKPATKVLAGRS